jgi:hypothetical protein
MRHEEEDYKEVSPEPKDYGGTDYSDDCRLSLWAAAGRDDNDFYYWEEVPKEKPPEGPNGGGNDDAAMVATTAAPTTAETLEMTTLSGCIRCVLRLAVTPSRSSTHQSTSVSRPWRR